jgi:hypothetical protein
MEFGKRRNFEGDFSLELNGCYESESDGVFISILRFKYFQKSLIEKIESDNQLIINELKNEDYEVARSMRNQFDVSSKLDFFIEQILKSNVVAIYSYFEFKLGNVSSICETNIHPKKKMKSFTKGSYIEKYNSFLISEIIPDLIDHSSIFQKILTWKDIRVDIVHFNSNIEKTNPENLSFSTLKTENGIIRFNNGDDILDLLDKIEKYLDTIVSLINSKYELIK